MTALPPELDEIAKLLRKDEPKVVLVIGAGVSLGATGLPQATWQGLLRHGIEHLRKIDYLTEAAEKKLLASIKGAFVPFDLSRALEHAESIESSLRLLDDKAYQEWLSSAFRDFKAKPDNSAVLAAIHELQQAGALVMTTNYDGLLEDATGLDPVTWEDHQAFNQVINGTRKGILHIHGHWQTPSSVVLGRSSYQRVLDAGDLQTVFRGLWLNWTWVYVGCGDGLDDENLGRLLEWGSKAFGASARTDYFLGVQATVDKLMAKPGRPVNLKVLGYQKHDDLPGVLQSMSVAAGCAPFQPLVEDHPLFRHPKGDEMVPFPTRQEYVAGNVPVLAADAIVLQRLEKYGWAFVMGKASVGKTTMALRLATAQTQRENPVFYLDLARHDPETQPERILRRLARPGTLIILDNTHHEPELARLLWDIWWARTADSRLLVISTEMQRLAIFDPSQEQSFFMKHPENPGVDIVTTPEDIGRIVEYLYRRIAGSRATALPKPQTDALRILHDRFGSALGAFSLGVLAHLDEFGKGNWGLPLSAAADWVRAKWLKCLDVRTLANLRCICVFGRQDLELAVQREALPYPYSLDQLLKLGLLQLTRRGKLRQHLRFSLREPSWGPMILEAEVIPVDEEALLHVTAVRHWTAAVSLVRRYRATHQGERIKRLAAAVAANPNAILSQIPDATLLDVPGFIDALLNAGQKGLASTLWDTMVAADKRVLTNVWETPLKDVAAFIDRVKGQPKLVDALWAGLNAEPARLLARAWEAPLDDLAAFIERAKGQPDILAGLFDGLAAQPERLGCIAENANCAHLTAFLRSVPTPLALSALSPLTPDHWDRTPADLGLAGATALAPLCEFHGRVDLGEGIKKCLLLRANPKDHSMTGVFNAVTWLVTHAPGASQALVPTFLDTVCTDEWLVQQFRFAAPTALAKGLRNLGECASSALMSAFEHPALGRRISRDVLDFEKAVPTKRCQTIELIGCAALVDWRAPREWLLPHSPWSLAELPRHHQPHQPDVEWVQDYQYHLWLGLRVYAAVTGRRVPVGIDLIQQTLSLWQGNLGYSSQDKDGTAHQLDASMIRWLERCRGNLRGDLLPDFEWLGDVCRSAKKS